MSNLVSYNRIVRACGALFCAAIILFVVAQRVSADTQAASTQVVSVPPDAIVFDEVVYQVGQAPILRSDIDKASIFLRVQALLDNQSLPAPSEDEIIQYLIDFTLQRQWCDRFGIVVSDDRVLETLQMIATARGGNLTRLRDEINQIDQRAYEIFYDFYTEQLRFSQLHIAIARQRIRISDYEIGLQYLALPDWRVTADYVLLFAEQENAALRAEITTALLEKDFETLKRFASLNTIRFLQYVDQPIGNLPGTIADHLPKDSGLRRFQTESGENWVFLHHRTITNPELQEYKVEQLAINQPYAVNRDVIDALRNALLNNSPIIRLLREERFATLQLEQVAASDDGWAMLGRLPPAIAQALLTAQAGDVTEPISVGDALYIVRVAAIRQASEKQMQAFIKRQLFNRRFPATVNNWLIETKSRTYIRQLR